MPAVLVLSQFVPVGSLLVTCFFSSTESRTGRFGHRKTASWNPLTSIG